MIGLEYILGLYNMQHIDLADKLGIKKQNINLWIKGRQNISKKYLPILEDIFGIDQQYFVKELSEIEKLEIQKEKLKKDLNPVIREHEEKYLIGEINDFGKVPIYDKEELNTMERTIEKARLVSRFKNAMEILDDNPYIDTYKLIVELMEKAQHEVIVHKTIEALAHYLELLPDRVSTGEEQDEFESEIFEVFDDNNF
ncbi:helix-turn-helix domain-containing protein [Clostridium manihotivorum]|uniref:Transcriptional regulator n=1 Tax=Clostridium manihotivorum TaxID=2320868 RepID=A0A410DQL6_9CLOT|nr:helix-turn-helix domain-containing protein [Clostridium manihotivorum]QAA31310.1 transcriptional regulator [Clostridium manihotivorum]